MSLFPRFAAHDFPRIINSELAPVWRVLDDYANQLVSARSDSAFSQVSSFSPRFDVQEVEGAYDLKGELPGVEQKDVEIEFPDRQTIVIKGQTGYTREQAPAQEAAPEVEETRSQQATVEDEPELIEASEAEGSSVPTPAASEAEQPQTIPAPQASAKTSKYWLSERYTGSFQRTFSFPAPVDTENAKAKLRNGVLEVTIPKVQKAGVRRISVE